MCLRWKLRAPDRRRSVGEVAELVAGGPQATGPEEVGFALRSSILPAASAAGSNPRGDESAEDAVAARGSRRRPTVGWSFRSGTGYGAGLSPGFGCESPGSCFTWR